MNIYNLGTTYKYEVWGAFHKDKENYPDRKFFTSKTFGAAENHKIPTAYIKDIIEVKTIRSFVVQGEIDVSV